MNNKEIQEVLVWLDSKLEFINKNIRETRITSSTEEILNDPDIGFPGAYGRLISRADITIRDIERVRSYIRLLIKPQKS